MRKTTFIPHGPRFTNPEDEARVRIGVRILPRAMQKFLLDGAAGIRVDLYSSGVCDGERVMYTSCVHTDGNQQTWIIVGVELGFIPRWLPFFQKPVLIVTCVEKLN